MSEHEPDLKVTEKSIRDRISTVRYVYNDLMTVCLITMTNGFIAIGKSAPASAANYDLLVGHRFAFEDAFRSLWQLEGYLLREKLAQRDGYRPAGLTGLPSSQT